MRMIDISKQNERIEFAEEAAAYFSEHPEKTTYTSGEILAGELFALRFGLGEDCVVVFRLDEHELVENYQNLIKTI